MSLDLGRHALVVTFVISHFLIASSAHFPNLPSMRNLTKKEKNASVGGG
jgi:hypothetical protein